MSAKQSIASVECWRNDSDAVDSRWCFEQHRALDRNRSRLPSLWNAVFSARPGFSIEEHFSIRIWLKPSDVKESAQIWFVENPARGLTLSVWLLFALGTRKRNTEGRIYPSVFPSGFALRRDNTLTVLTCRLCCRKPISEATPDKLAQIYGRAMWLKASRTARIFLMILLYLAYRFDWLRFATHQSELKMLTRREFLPDCDRKTKQELSEIFEALADIVIPKDIPAYRFQAADKLLENFLPMMDHWNGLEPIKPKLKALTTNSQTDRERAASPVF